MCPVEPGAEIDLTRVICALAELDDPGSREFSIGGGDWPLRGFVVRRGAEVHAYVNRCPHAGYPLNLRPDDFLTLDRSLVLCRSHGALFEITTGLCIAGPCAGRQLRRVPLEIVGGHVQLAADVRAEELAD
jgi:nitrite reductase/ring-hydroxylating ferredoxin subunit